MLRSLYSSISGLRVHQQMLDVTGNNIANVNTVGFKSSQTTFRDTLSEILQAAGAPGPDAGGMNPAQVGLGVRLDAITTNFSQGGSQTTGRGTDLRIQGDGFFVVRAGGEQLYTRAGAFSFDSQGRLVNGAGYIVQGWTAVNGVVDTNGPLQDVVLPFNATVAPRATTVVRLDGNVPDDIATPITLSTDTYDALGNRVPVTVQIAPGVNPGEWVVTATRGTATNSATFITGGTGTFPPAASVTVDGVTVDLSALTAYAGEKTVRIVEQDGAPAGTLQAYTISPDGTIVGVFSNGQKEVLAQIALANFANPAGLEKAGDSTYRTTLNSGLPQIGTAGAAGLGSLQSGVLESSNVDLAAEFTNLIIAQRGFQANSRVITTSDELLHDLINLKR
ncbi:MAG TPA: flagellar hook protein FlgE [Micromonospora sp.]